MMQLTEVVMYDGRAETATVKEVKITLPDGTEYVGPPLDEPCDECGVPAGVPCLPDPGEYEEDDA